MPTPWLMLAAVVAMLMIVWLADRNASNRRAARMSRLAQRCGFRYSEVDRFALAKRIRPTLCDSVEGVVVRDLMYRSGPDGYVYAFTAARESSPQNTVVVCARESPGDPQLIDLKWGDDALPVGEQYRRLLHEAVPAGLAG